MPSHAIRARLRRAAVPEKAMMVQNPAHTVLELAAHTLAGEIAFRKGNTAAAVAELTKAVEIEDGLRYMEPPDWFQPVRHSLGAVLMAADRKSEAEQVYREDLERHPNNGWALVGLEQALRTQDRTADDDDEPEEREGAAGADYVCRSEKPPGAAARA